MSPDEEATTTRLEAVLAEAESRIRAAAAVLILALDEGGGALMGHAVTCAEVVLTTVADRVRQVEGDLLHMRMAA